jgi:uncharacterized membrane protein required for colicin V production
MNWLDIVILLSFAFLTYTGFSAGLLREAIILLAALVGVALAGVAYDDLAGDLETFVDSEQDALLLAYLSLVGAVILGGVIVSYMIKTALAVVYLGSFDSIGGGICGFLKAFVIIQAVLIGFVTFGALGVDDAIDDSFLASLILDEFGFLKVFLPGVFDSAIDRV